MIEINFNYLKLSDDYLFNQVEKAVKECGYIDVINMGVGDTTRPIPKFIEKAYVKAVRSMGNRLLFKGYSPDTGYDFFKAAVQQRYKSLGVNLNSDEIFINDGAKNDLFILPSLFKNTNALIHNPVYPAYRDVTTVYGNTPFFIASTKENGFLPLPSDLDKSLKFKSFIIYICSPDNPTGTVYDRDGLKEWVNFAKQSGSVIIFDSAYADYIRGDYPKTIFQVDGAEDVAIEVHSLSKSVNFTGVRCGFTVIKNQLVFNGQRINKLFSRLKSASGNGVCYVAQVAGAAALSKKGQKECLKNTDYYLKNAKILKNFFVGKQIFTVGGENSPYVFFKCPEKINSFDFCRTLLNEVGVAATPGAGFGENGEGYVRLTGFSTLKNTLKAVERLNEFFKNSF